MSIWREIWGISIKQAHIGFWRCFITNFQIPATLQIKPNRLTPRILWKQHLAPLWLLYLLFANCLRLFENHRKFVLFTPAAWFDLMILLAFYIFSKGENLLALYRVLQRRSNQFYLLKISMIYPLQNGFKIKIHSLSAHALVNLTLITFFNGLQSFLFFIFSVYNTRSFQKIRSHIFQSEIDR